MRGFCLNKIRRLGGYSLKTLFFYGILTTLAIVVIMMIVSVSSRTKFTGGEVPLRCDLILDAGHGGLDGGAVSGDGICEAPLTLQITLKTRDVFTLFGFQPLLTRSDDHSLGFDPEASIRQNKRADLEGRLACMRQWPDAPFISIHLNQFPDPKYRGAQAFYAANGKGGEVLADKLQKRLCGLDPENGRVYKPSPEGVFLMKNACSAAVTVECGFLSNPEECALLQEKNYQTKIALAVLGGYLDYIRG